MIYYFLYIDNLGRIHRKRFTDVALAVRHRKLWCTNYAFLMFETTRHNLEKNLDVKVDTVQKAEELFDNLMADAMRKSSVKSADEFNQYIERTKKSFEQLNQKNDV